MLKSALGYLWKTAVLMRTILLLLLLLFRSVQGCCLTGDRDPEAPKTCLRATNILNKEPERAPKISDYDYLMGLGIAYIPTSSEFGLKS